MKRIFNTLHNISIRLKITILLVMIVLLGAGAILYYFPKEQKREIIDTLSNQSQVLSKVMGYAFGVAMDAENYDAIKEGYSLITRESEINYILLYDKEGELISEYNPNQIKISQTPFHFDSGVREYKRRKILEAVAPIVYNSEEFGNLVIGVDLRPYEAKIQNLYNLALYVFVAIILLSWFSAYILSRQILRPLFKVRDVIKLVGEGNLSKRVQLKHRDEIGEIGAALDTTIDNLLQINDELAEAQQELLLSANLSGKAEMSTGVLHDIGNLLNSLNISNETIREQVKTSKLHSLEKACELIPKSSQKQKEFFTTDPKGEKLPEFFRQLAPVLHQENDRIFNETKELREMIAVMKGTIQVQQEYARADYLIEQVNLPDVLNKCLIMLKDSIHRHHIQVESQFVEHKIEAVKSKTHNVFINIIKNAIEALKDNPVWDRKIIIQLKIIDQEYTEVHFVDNGPGISAENKNKVFTNGFTTKLSGHGFGLHHCANAMTEMNGKLEVQSEEGEGCRFVASFSNSQVKESII